MLTFGIVVALAIGVYGQRAIGMTAIDASRLGAKAQAVMNHIPIAILSAVIALQMVTTAGEIDVDARVYGVGAAAFTASRRLPMFVSVIIAPVVTATVRALS